MKAFLLGAGKSANAIYNAALLRNDLEIVAVGGGKGHSAELLAKKTKIPLAQQQDWGEILDSVDVALIASPHYFHVEQILDALERKCHVLVDKPMAIDTIGFNRIQNALESVKQHVYCGFVQRCSVEMTSCREFLSLRCKEILGASITQFLSRDINYYSTWKGNPVISGGGVLVNQAIHAIDLALYLMRATPEKVSCIMSTSRDILVEDNINASIFTDCGHISINAMTYAAIEESQVIRIFLPECTIIVVGTETPKWTISYGGAEDVIAYLAKDTIPFGIGHAEWIDDAIKSIAQSSESNYQCDIKGVESTHECIFALYKSASNDGMVVEI